MLRRGALLLLGVLACVWAQDQVSFGGGKIRFSPPVGLEPMSPEMILVKYPNAPVKPLAYATDRGRISVAFQLTNQPLKPEQLNEAQVQLAAYMDKMGQVLTWKRKEQVQQSGRPWVHFEFVSKAVDTNIHNHMYLTSHEGKMLLLNFNAVAADYPKWQAAFDKSWKSVRLQ
jgi:hypothetical protein